jgi:hypothetical protein
MRPHLLEQVSAFLGLERLDQMLFRGRQNAFEPDDNQMRANVFRTPAHIFLFKAAHALRNGTFDPTLRFHQEKQGYQIFPELSCLTGR